MLLLFVIEVASPCSQSAWRGGSPECQKTSQRISRGTCRPSRSQALVRHNLTIARVSTFLTYRPAARSPHQFQDGLAQVDGGHAGEETEAPHRWRLGDRARGSTGHDREVASPCCQSWKRNCSRTYCCARGGERMSPPDHRGRPELTSGGACYRRNERPGGPAQTTRQG